jgi:hypothetical protein
LALQLLESKMMTRAAFLATTLLFIASSAVGGTVSRSFMVSAIVARSATVSVSIGAAAKNGVHVEQTASRGTSAAMILVGNQLKPMSQSAVVARPAAPSATVTVTVLY